MEELLQLHLQSTISPSSGSSDDPSGRSPAKEQQAAGLGILLQIMMLVLAFVLGHLLRRHKFYYLPEASASLLIGILVGVLANISDTETSMSISYYMLYLLSRLLNCFFLIDLVRTQSGFSLSPKPFFSNFGAIVTFAIFGTFIASMVTGVLVYLGGLTYLTYKLPFVECLMFGALISATDPVTVLSIFQELGSDVNLYALVFGESVLNDATTWSMHCWKENIGLIEGGSFFFSYCNGRYSIDGNIFIQNHVLVKWPYGIWPKLLYIDHSLSHYLYWIDVCSLQNLECCLFVLFPYFSYMLAEGIGLSGIVSILFTGIVMKHYAYSNLSDKSQRFASAFFHLLSSLAETFVAANVFSCAYLVNLVRPSHRRIPMNHQKALWYSGLRGAMAFALALQSVHDLPEGHGQTIFTATTSIVVLTVLLIGGSTGSMLEALEVVGDEHDSTFDERFERNLGYIAPTYDEDSTSGSRLKTKLKELRRSTATFSALDRNYLTPFFTSQNGDDDDDNEEEHDGPMPSSSRGGTSARG
ncbi:hypothetical protein ACFE04_000139 [Oxalis oulophora]